MLLLSPYYLAHVLAAVPAVLPTMCQSPNVSLNTDETVLSVSRTDRQIVCIRRVGCTAAAAAAWQ